MGRQTQWERVRSGSIVGANNQMKREEVIVNFMKGEGLVGNFWNDKMKKAIGLRAIFSSFPTRKFSILNHVAASGCGEISVRSAIHKADSSLQCLNSSSVALSSAQHE